MDGVPRGEYLSPGIYFGELKKTTTMKKRGIKYPIIQKYSYIPHVSQFKTFNDFFLELIYKVSLLKPDEIKTFLFIWFNTDLWQITGPFVVRMGIRSSSLCMHALIELILDTERKIKLFSSREEILRELPDLFHADYTTLLKWFSCPEIKNVLCQLEITPEEGTQRVVEIHQELEQTQQKHAEQEEKGEKDENIFNHLS
jgi:hypothetical protein